MKDLLNGYKQHSPYHIEIEPTEGCNLGCSFCGLRGIREHGTKPWKFMTIETAKEIARKIRKENWNSTEITFCGHGEPTLNPNLLEIIKIFREYLPENRFTVWTNGYGFKTDKFEINYFVEQLKNLRVCDLRIDVYSNKGDWNKIENLKNFSLDDIKIIGQDGTDLNYRGKQLRIVLYPMDVGDKNSYLRNLANHCGAAAPLNYDRKFKRCHKPFRYLFIRWDGNVNLCCDDFRGQYKIANVLDENLSLEDIWNHERFQAARVMLLDGKRIFKPCLGCSRLPIRAGLLPDPCAQDKDLIPKPENISDLKSILEYAYDVNGSTTIVKREWEK